MGMATSPPVYYGLPIEMHVPVIDIVDVKSEITYRKCTTTIWVQEDTNKLVLNRYEAWFFGLTEICLDPFLTLIDHSELPMTPCPRGL